jgi:signal transduction histidine kinase
VTDHLAFAPEILRRLGEELVPHADQGIVELARNSYDANATTCVISLDRVDAPGGSVTITDNGDGMSRSDIAEGWLVLGRSSKDRRSLTRLNRVPAGDKGLGRLAALRLASVAALTTRPREEPGVEYQMELDWRRFDGARLVEDVPIVIHRRDTTQEPGTVIELRDLRVRLRRADLQRLARALILLSDPFESASGFRPELLAPGFAEMEQRVRAQYFDEVEYRIHAEIDDHGIASAALLDWRGEVVRRADHPKIAGRSKRTGAYETSPAMFDLWAFNLSGAAFTSRSASVTEVREWISVVGGVHIYQSNLRVPPYGDNGADWLNMNLRRARSPELRPSTNTSVGRVTLDDEDQRLVQKTDRSGFVENEAFTELRSFAMDALDWAAAERLQDAEKRRNAERERAKKNTKTTEQDVQTVEETLQAAELKDASSAFDRYRSAIDRQMRSLREDVQLYRTLGTVGTTTSAFAHESIKPAGRIEQAAKVIRSKGLRIFGDPFEEALGSQFESLLRSARALGRWAQMPLHLLKRDSRRAIRFDLSQTVEEVIDMLGPFMAEARIDLSYDKPLGETPIYGPPAAAEAIVMNLVVNSINALLEEESPHRVRRIKVDCEDSGDGFVALTVGDSGPGIVGIDIEEIWLPGRTTREGGTGLGLTIVRDSVLDLGGEIAVAATGALGGAEFIVLVPMLDQESV